MPRPRRCRRVGLIPKVNYFKPVGVPMKILEEVTLTIDEFEAVRLKDFLGKEQKEAAEEMNISQPTLHRLLVSARKKISESIIKGKALKIEGGNYSFSKQHDSGVQKLCICLDCGFKHSVERGKPCNEQLCPKCGSLIKRVR
ncbi:MAG: DUF134 domain-containing protein [Nanoarchaeota archaeon]|nr:DUF134 domain-containing protein [Nanoarchaeota archaeon]